MRWSLNEIVTDSSRVQFELCCEDCQGDRTVCKQQEKSWREGSHVKTNLLNVDSFGYLSNHGFDVFSANTVKRESTNHSFNAFNSDAEERIDEPQFQRVQLRRRRENRPTTVSTRSTQTQKRESTNHSFNAFNSDAEERIDEPQFQRVQLRRRRENRRTTVSTLSTQTQKRESTNHGFTGLSANTVEREWQEVS